MAVKNDVAWSSILEANPEILQSIQNTGFFDIESKEIKEFREPRLACKIDYREQIPGPLKNQSLSVLAIRNGVYRIAHSDPFIDFPILPDFPTQRPVEFELPSYIRSLSVGAITSEAKALDAAQISGMLEHVFGERVQLAIRGYERSGNFEFTLPNSLSANRSVGYQIEGVQIEVDGGYEGKRGIYLVEAKNKVNNNINLRQLLYPQMHYMRKFSNAKVVKSYVMLFDQMTNVYHFSRYSFDAFANQGPAVQLYPDENFVCRIKSENTRVRDLWRELHYVPINNDLADNNRPFPQADDFSKILALFYTIGNEAEISIERLFGKYAIVPRQHDYYSNAIRWLRLASSVKVGSERHLVLTKRGKSVLSLRSPSARLFEIAKYALSNDIFNQYIHSNESGVTNEARFRNRLRKDSTYYRRLKTVESWLNYFKQHLSP